MSCTLSTPWSSSECTPLTCQQCRSAPLKAQPSLGKNLRKLVAIDYRCLRGGSCQEADMEWVDKEVEGAAPTYIFIYSMNT